MQTRKNQIIEAAVQLMYVKGYKGTSLHEVAKQLEISEPALYHYFSNKEQLLCTIVGKALDTSLQKLKEIRALNVSPREKIQRIARMYAHLVLENPMMIIYFNNKQELSTENLQYFTENEHRFITGVRETLAEEMPSDSPIDPTVATFALIGMCSWLNRWVRPDGPLTTDQIVDQFLWMLDHGIL